MLKLYAFFNENGTYGKWYIQFVGTKNCVVHLHNKQFVGLWGKVYRSYFRHTNCEDKQVFFLQIQFGGTNTIRLWFNYFKHSLWGQVCGAITQFMGTSLWFIFFTHSLWDRSAVNLLYAQLVRQIFISVTVHTTLG